MADVVLGRAGSEILIDLGVCAKSGRPTGDRVTFRGSTTPAWVTVLLLVTIVGFLLANAMTSRRYRVTLPLVHAAYARWKRIQLAAWIIGLGGMGAVIAAATNVGGEAQLWGVVGIALVAAALVGGTVNGVVNGLAFRMTRQDDLVVTRAHPAFAQAVATASFETTQL